MANVETEVSVKVSVDNSAAVKSVGELKDQIKNATTNLNDLKAKFGETSKEVQQAEAELQKLNEQLQTPKVSDAPENSVKSLKVQLREANTEFLKLAAEFGEFSAPAQEAAKKVAELKDQIGDAKALTDAFNPDRKFQAFSGALQSVAGGFAAVQGAQALFGSESKELEKTLVKVQGALALSQGINSILEAKDSFKTLKIVAIDAFNGIKTAIGSTGIGLLVVALGAIYAYWDDIKEAVSGVSSEQLKQNEQLKTTATLEQDKLNKLGDQDNVLKLQGKSEREILNQKLKQYDVTIKATEASIQSEITIQKQKEENAKRNFDITKNIIKGAMEIATLGLRLLSAPIDAVLATANKVSETLGFGKIVSTDLNDQITKLNESVSTYAASVFFDPAEVKKEGEKTNKEALDNLNKLKNDRAGIQLQINGIDKEAAKKRLDQQKTFNDELKKLQDENALNELKTEREKTFKKLEQDKLNEDARIKGLQIKQSEKNILLNENDKKYQIEKRKLEEQFRKEDAKNEADYQNKLNEIRESIRIAGITNQYDKQIEELKNNYKKQYAEIEKSETDSAERKLELKKQLQLKEQSEIDAIEKNRAVDLINKQLTELDAILKNNDAKLSARKDALAQEEALNKESLEKGYITKEEYVKKDADLEKQKTAIQKEEAQQRIDVANAVADSLGKLSDLVGKQTAVGKGLAVAQATINTFLGATEVIKQKSVLPEPAATISKVINVATIVASGIKSVKEILKVKVDGASGGSAPTGAGVTAPISPQATSTLMNQNQINQLSSATTRAFVLESDVSGNQERIQRLNRAARIN